MLEQAWSKSRLRSPDQLQPQKGAVNRSIAPDSVSRTFRNSCSCSQWEEMRPPSGGASFPT